MKRPTAARILGVDRARRSSWACSRRSVILPGHDVVALLLRAGGARRARAFGLRRQRRGIARLSGIALARRGAGGAAWSRSSRKASIDELVALVVAIAVFGCAVAWHSAARQVSAENRLRASSGQIQRGRGRRSC